MDKITELVILLKYHRVFIQTHNYPDPDALAAAFGLKELLDFFDVKADIIFEGSLDKVTGKRMVDEFDMEIHPASNFDDMNEEDYIVLVDCQKYNRNCTDLPGDEVACIDHHPTFTKCDYKFKDIKNVGACSSIVADYYRSSGVKPSRNVATALVYGIKMDTNNFGRGVTQMDVDMYAWLFEYSDKKVLEKMQLNSIEFSDLKAYGAAVNNISTYKNIGFAEIPFDCPDGLIAVISDFLLGIDTVDFSVVWSIRDRGYKFSLRSELKSMDAGKLMQKVADCFAEGSGGGHQFMAGGFIPVHTIEQVGVNPRKIIEETFIELIENS